MYITIFGSSIWSRPDLELNLWTVKSSQTDKDQFHKV